MLSEEEEPSASRLNRPKLHLLLPMFIPFLHLPKLTNLSRSSISLIAVRRSPISISPVHAILPSPHCPATARSPSTPNSGLRASILQALSPLVSQPRCGNALRVLRGPAATLGNRGRITWVHRSFSFSFFILASIFFSPTFSSSAIEAPLHSRSSIASCVTAPLRQCSPRTLSSGRRTIIVPSSIYFDLRPPLLHPCPITEEGCPAPSLRPPYLCPSPSSLRTSRC